MGDRREGHSRSSAAFGESPARRGEQRTHHGLALHLREVLAEIYALDTRAPIGIRWSELDGEA